MDSEPQRESIEQSAFRRATPHVTFLEPDPRTDRPVLGVVTGSRRTLLVDAGNSPAHVRLLLDHLSDAQIRPPDLVAITHWHWDHVFGIATLDLPTLAHVETKRIVAEMAHLDWSDRALDRRVEQGLEIAFCRDMIKTELPDRSDLVLRPPDIGFTDRVTIDLGGVECHLIHVGGDHSTDASVIHVPQDGIALLGDCLAPDIYHGAHRYTVDAALRLVDRLLALEADRYLEGHATEPMTREELAAYAQLFHTVAQLAGGPSPDRAAILDGVRERFGTRFEDEHAEIVDAFLAAKDGS